MGIEDDAVEIRSQGWRTLATLHGRIESALERALVAEAQLSVVEFTVLDALRRQDGWHMRMQQLARATALSPSATTRLVTRLEDRGLLTRILCADDRRGIYIELTAAGQALLEKATPIHAATLERALREAQESAELVPLVEALQRLPDPIPGSGSVSSTPVGNTPVSSTLVSSTPVSSTVRLGGVAWS